MVRKLTKSSTAFRIAINPLAKDPLPLPKLIVFDLDYTLWPFWVDTHVTPPIKATETHDSVQDRTSESYAFYVEVPGVLSSLREQNVKIAAASRTHAPDLGIEMLRLLHVPGRERQSRRAIEYFDYLEIYPGSKITHFKALQKRSGIAYEDMLFFDDESRNRVVESLGVHFSLVRDGVTKAEVDKGIRQWRTKHGHALEKDGDSGYGGCKGRSALPS